MTEHQEGHLTFLGMNAHDWRQVLEGARPAVNRWTGEPLTLDDMVAGVVAMLDRLSDGHTAEQGEAAK